MKYLYCTSSLINQSESLHNITISISANYHALCFSANQKTDNVPIGYLANQKLVHIPVNFSPNQNAEVI